MAEVVIDRGFGFIDGDDGQRYFFHRGALAGPDFGELAPGTAVEFGVQPHAEGDEPGERPRAVNIRLTEDAIPAVDNEALPAAKIGAAYRSTPSRGATRPGDPAATAPRETYRTAPIGWISLVWLEPPFLHASVKLQNELSAPLSLKETRFRINWRSTPPPFLLARLSRSHPQADSAKRSS